MMNDLMRPDEEEVEEDEELFAEFEEELEGEELAEVDFPEVNPLPKVHDPIPIINQPQNTNVDDDLDALLMS